MSSTLFRPKFFKYIFTDMRAFWMDLLQDHGNLIEFLEKSLKFVEMKTSWENHWNLDQSLVEKQALNFEVGTAFAKYVGKYKYVHYIYVVCICIYCTYMLFTDIQFNKPRRKTFAAFLQNTR